MIWCEDAKREREPEKRRKGDKGYCNYHKTDLQDHRGTTSPFTTPVFFFAFLLSFLFVSPGRPRRLSFFFSSQNVTHTIAPRLTPWLRIVLTTPTNYTTMFAVFLHTPLPPFTFIDARGIVLSWHPPSLLTFFSWCGAHFLIMGRQHSSFSSTLHISHRGYVYISGL